MMNALDVRIPTESLPLWMRQARRGVDWGVLIVLALSLLAAWPFLLQDGLPRTNASENYIYLTSDYATALREGRLYPRWSPHALNGYGAPIPNFLPPGAPYTAAVTELAFTNDTARAVRLVYVASFVLAGAATHAFVMRFAGATGGVLAAILYVYSPYLGLTAPHLLGDFPGVIALGLLPALLWSVNRLLLRCRSFDLTTVTLITSALILTDSRMAIVALLLVMLPIVHYSRTARYRQRRIRRTLFAIALGILLSSFYWIPAALEQHTIRWQASGIDAPIYDLTAEGLAAPLQRIDLLELVPRPQFTIGLPLVLATLGGIAAVIYLRHWRSLAGLFLMCGLALMVIAVRVFPTETWLLGPISFCLAVGASNILKAIPQIAPDSERLLLPVLVIVALMLATPVWLAPRWDDTFGQITPYDHLNYESRGFGVASLPPGHDIPMTIAPDLPSSLYLTNGYRTGEINRIAPDQISANSQALLFASNSHSDLFQVFVRDGATFTLLRSYFPGWEAEINDEPVGLDVDPETGLIRVAVPNNTRGNLSLRLESTTVRQRSWLLSWVTLALLGVVSLRQIRRSPASHYDEIDLLPVVEARLVMVIVGGFSAILLLFAIPGAPLSLHARPGHALDNSVSVQSRTEAGMELLSYRLEDATIGVEDTLRVTLVWRTSRTLWENFEAQVHLRDPNQNIRWQESDIRQPAGYPTQRWTPNRYVRQTFELPLSDAIFSGEYELAVEVYACTPDCNPARRLTFFDSAGLPFGQVLVLPVRITVTP